ncbi:MAG: DUF3754 domain-containing protein [Cyanobacteriota bacterium]
MAAYSDREAFIPYRRCDLIELCVKDGQLPATEVQKFRQFCSLLAAYYHFQFHSYLETLKANYAPFDPDADTKSLRETSPEERISMESQLVSDFKKILERANYIPLSKASLRRAFKERSLIALHTSVDFNDFDQMACYYRGDTFKLASIKKFFRKVEKTVNVFERVALLLKFKNEAYFVNKKVKIESLSFTPGKTYVYLYKNIPKFDLEFLFPNVKTSMTWKDRLLFGVPAIGAAIPLILRVLPQLLLVLGVILFITIGPSPLEALRPSEKDLRDIVPVLLAILSLVVTLGGFAFKQYSSYKSKQIKFQKKVTETLFFKNLASNASVFGALIDAAEEEECKEILLVYYHLLTSNDELTAEQLDNQIEVWMDEKFGTRIDFDINGPLKNLEAIQGKIIKDGAQKGRIPEVPLLKRDSQGKCHVLPLDDALAVIDYIWDNAFLFTKCRK